MGRTARPGQQSAGESGDFLARWSRRKIEARDGAARPEDPDARAVPPTGPEAAAPPARRPEQELTDADMPPIDTLTADSDFAPFLSPGVSDGLRQKALRILFRQPACNITDGLNDYDDDYTQFAGLGDCVTHEMKRMLRRELEAEQHRREPADAVAQESRSTEAIPPAAPAPQEAPSAATGQLDEDSDDTAARG